MYLIIHKQNKIQKEKDNYVNLCSKILKENKTWLNKSNCKKNLQNNNMIIGNILKNLIK